MPHKKLTPHWPSYARALKRDAKALAKKGARGADFTPLVNDALAIADPYYRAMALSWVGRQMGEAGQDAGKVFRSALASARGVDQEWRRAEMIIQVTAEMTKAGLEDYGDVVKAVAGITMEKHRKMAAGGVRRKLKWAKIEVPGGLGNMEPLEKKGPREKAGIPRPKAPTRKVTLGLYNTYEGKDLMEAHLRAVARAAPLCHAYDFNLALIGFPVDDLETLVDMVESQTRVGKKGTILTGLYNDNRIYLMDPPESLDASGLPRVVATTSHPDPGKRITPEAINKSQDPTLVLMGLGPKGLPGRSLKAAWRHLEITGRDIPLETCTAMGVIGALLGAKGNL